MPSGAQLRTYLNDRRGGSHALAAILRPAFALTFLAQAGMAAILVVVISLVQDERGTSSPWTAPVSTSGSALLMLAGVIVAGRGVRAAAEGTRRWCVDAAGPDADEGALLARLREIRTGALHTAMMSGGLLAGPSWFAALAWLAGDGGTGFLAPSVLAVVAYFVGSLQMTALARASAVAPAPVADGEPVGPTTAGDARPDPKGR